MKKIIHKIILFLFNSRLKKYLKTNNREKRFVNYKSARSIILLFESDLLESNLEIKQLIQTFNHDGKKVMAYGYVHKDEISSSILSNFRILFENDIDFTGLPNKTIIQEVSELNFDLLIDLTVNEKMPLQYLALYSNAACKVSTHNLRMYDMIINVQQLKAENQLNEKETTAIQIYNLMLFYLKSIQTND